MPNKPTTPYCHLFSVSVYKSALSKKQVRSSCTNSQPECVRLSYPREDSVRTGHHTLLLATKAGRSKYRTSEEPTKEQQPGRRTCLRQVPCTSFLQHPGVWYQEQTCSHMSLSWTEPWNECTIQHGLYTSYVEDQGKKKKQRQSQKSLQFQLHIRKPST